jgi:hypothetical protein
MKNILSLNLFSFNIDGRNISMVDFYRGKNENINPNMPAVRQNIDRDVNYIKLFIFLAIIYHFSVSLSAEMPGHSSIPAHFFGQNVAERGYGTNFQPIIEGKI